MALEVKLWQIASDRPEPVARQPLDLEGRLEDWLCRDISLLSDDLLVIGRQIRQYGAALDLLAVDQNGNLVVIEPKRDKTPRDVVAQTLDYASWVQGLGREDVEHFTHEHLGESFNDAFQRAFGREAPEIVNERQRMYIVASALDSATQRIIEYLSTTHGVDINAATFAYFDTPSGEFVARSMLLDEEGVERRARDRHTSKRPPPRSAGELRVIAEEYGVADLWDHALEGFSRVAKQNTSRTTLYFQAKLDGGLRAVISIDPALGSPEQGLAVTVIVHHIVRAFGVEEERIRDVCGTPAGTSFGGSYSTSDNCFHLDRGRLDALVNLLAGSGA